MNGKRKSFHCELLNGSLCYSVIMVVYLFFYIFNSPALNSLDDFRKFPAYGTSIYG